MSKIKEVCIQYSETVPDSKIQFKNKKIGKILTVILDEGDNEREISKALFLRIKKDVKEELE